MYNIILTLLYSIKYNYYTLLYCRLVVCDRVCGVEGNWYSVQSSR